MVILLYLLSILWVVSLFEFARLRISLSENRAERLWIHKDRVFLLYLRISGTIIFSVILFFINAR